MSREKKSKQANSCIEIIENGTVLTSPEIVLGTFETFYKSLYTAQNKEQFDDNFKRKTENTFKHMLNESYKHKQDFLETNISENELVTILSKLKRRKAPGWDHVQNEHILFGGRTLRVVLLKLYNAILHLELVPRIW